MNYTIRRVIRQDVEIEANSIEHAIALSQNVDENLWDTYDCSYWSDDDEPT